MSARLSSYGRLRHHGLLHAPCLQWISPSAGPLDFDFWALTQAHLFLGFFDAQGVNTYFLIGSSLWTFSSHLCLVLSLVIVHLFSICYQILVHCSGLVLARFKGRDLVTLPVPQRNRPGEVNLTSESGLLPLFDAAAKRSSCSFLKGRGSRALLHFPFWFAVPDPFPFPGLPVCLQCHFGASSFDQTCGYPGEGPHPHDMVLHSANIGSIQTNTEWKSWSSHITCLQETRIGRNNFRTASFAIREAGYCPVFGDLLPGFIPHKGKPQTPCGGTAVLGPPALTQPFEPKDDVTGLFDKLHRSKRFAFAWIQVTPTRQALICSLYAITGASQDQTTHDENNALFQDLFVFLSQFGSIPMVVAGDFQANPLSYPAISEAFHCHNWNDPLNNVDGEGQIDRPFTYSRDSLFSGCGDACSSIDAVLLNQPAFYALKQCEVVPLVGKQHRPIRCTFTWSVLSQVGYTLYKFAPLDVPLPQQNKESNQNCFDNRTVLSPTQRWERNWAQKFNDDQDPDSKWSTLNQFLIDQLLSQGAYWGSGPPRFVAKTICPVQYRDHCAATKTSAWLFKLQGRLSELFIRRSRIISTSQDQFIFDRTAIKVSRALKHSQYPHEWPHPRLVTLVHIQLASQWVRDQVTMHSKNVKNSRIKQWKQRIKDSASRGCSFVFQHLRNRLVDEPPNLVQNDEGNILYQPEEVLSHLNSKWDSVYSANTIHEHPLKMLEVVWPYIKDQAHNADLPPIDAQSLYKVIQRRKTNAAPGLDGWRTCELQSLPPQAFLPVAQFFQWAEDSFDSDLPKMLTCTKQIILHKPGPSEAMNKRLITILPALLLAYTGARYEQLQSWQQQTMPLNIVGGIKHRTMPMLHTALRLDLDQAKAEDQGLVGVKLDKAKCFDRIIPSHASALFLAFGLPKGLVNVFTKLYRGLHRHLCYKGWIQTTSTTAANGVAQGCSLSLIAINVHTKVWVHLLDHLPNITVKAYIDDAYLWCRIQNLAVLDQAIQVTKLWDSLNGQKLNDTKSIIWGSTTQARKQIQTVFPQMQLALSFDALGTKIYASERNDCDFSDARLRKTCMAIQCIGALPVPLKVKAYLIGSKAIPALTYGACISRTPKLALQKVQNEVVKALWQGRPPNRSKWLVQLFHGNPHRTDPQLAQAFATIMDVVRFCQMVPDTVDRLRALWPHKDSLKHSVLSRFLQACSTLQLTLTENMQISFRNSQPIQLGQCSTHDLQQTLKQLARQCAYENAALSKRKDFCRPNGLLDFHASTMFLRKPTFQTPSWPSATHRCESVIVGCTLTRDRLHAAGWSSTAMCRFCGKVKESLPHLVRDCEVYHSLTSTPVLHDLGNNFALLGHVEHPYRLSLFRLQSESPTPSDAVHFQPSLPTEERWTDGSVLWHENFWITTASYAVVDKTGLTLFSGRVRRWHLSSHVAELWAIWIAVSRSSAAVHIYCDNQTVVRNVQTLIHTGTVQRHWKCSNWWRALNELLTQRRLVHPAPLEITWIPAHLCEHIPDQKLDEATAAASGSTLLHVLRNRDADRAAKLCAQRIAPVFFHMPQVMGAATALHQEWLVRLHAHLDTGNDDEVKPDHMQAPPQTADSQITLGAAKTMFPIWHWHPHKSHFLWRPKVPALVEMPKRWRYSAKDWSTICNFVRGLRWREDADGAISFCELAVLFHHTGWRFEACSSALQIHEVTCKLRQAFQYLRVCLANVAFCLV